MIGDDIFSGASGAHRRFFSGVAQRFVDPFSFSGAAQAAGQAQNAPFGSIAQRNDPNRYGSTASRVFPGAFGPNGALNPDTQQNRDSTELSQRRSVDTSSSTPLMPANGASPYLLGLLNNSRAQPGAISPARSLDEDDDGN